MTSYYLGPGLNRWAPESWADLQRALGDGLLDETSWVELKGALERGKPANLEAARDLASLALDGGLLVVGVTEVPGQKGKAAEAEGCELGDLGDRITQVARDKIHPPLYVAPRVLEDPDRPGTGVLLVSVPRSPLGPHMADERYWGRSAVGKRVLSDSEVRSHFSRRQNDEQVFVETLQESWSRDPMRQGSQHGHILLVLQPKASTRAALLPFLGDPDAEARLRAYAIEASRRRSIYGGYRLGNMVHTFTRQDRGRAWTTHVGEIQERSLLHCLFDEDGTVSVVHGGVCLRPPIGSDFRPTLILGIAYALIYDALGIAGRLGDSALSYQGEWWVGVSLKDLSGAVAEEAARDPFGGGRAFEGNDYQEITASTTEEMIGSPVAITERLLGTLIRALGAEKFYIGGE